MRLARPGLGGPRGALGLGDLRLRPQDGMAVAEERVRVGDPVVGAREDPQHGLAAAQMRQPEPETVDLELGAGRDELRGVVLVLAAPTRPAGQPEPVGSPFGRPQRREREDLPGVDLLPVAERLEDGPAGKLLRRVAEHRPVRDLARRRPAGADAVDQPAGAARGEPVEVRRVRDLVRSPPAERVVRAVGEPVEKDDEDRIHGAEANGIASHSWHDPDTHACEFPE